jgi:peptidoglycan/xylan/chitin deacetylase (PgdA/CDA1 family)
VLFHTVDDRRSDHPIGCTTHTFATFCDFFQRYFHVVSLEELLDKLEKGEDVTGHLVVTFDDGYKDNYHVAAAELKRRNMPACFFVTTGFVASGEVPWWHHADPVRPEWMTWDEVRSLVEQGFEIGSHTVSHVDLGAVSGQTALSEIVTSKRQLARETSTTVELFAYPYGGADQITAENRDAVRNAGYRCCLSAYGGAVAPNTDPFFMKRVPVSRWYISPYHFGFEAMLLQS